VLGLPRLSASADVVTFGNTAIGAELDSDDAGWINGSRMTTGATGGTVSSISVYVGPVGAAPNNTYQVAIYQDANGTPGALMASSAIATLTADSWNTAPISATIAANTSYWLMYNASGTSGALNNMRYNLGGTNVYSAGRVAFGTWPATGWSGIGNANFSIYATYENGVGGSGSSTSTTTTLPGGGDTTAPAVAITQPTSGATLSGSTTFTATASDLGGVAGLQFLLDGNPIGAEVLSAPYTLTVDTATIANGSHSISARARDNSANTGTSTAVVVTVSNSTTSSTSSSTTSTSTSSTSSTSSSTSSTSSSTSSTSSSSSTTSTVAIDTVPPTIGVTAPAPGATLTGTALFTATATDNRGVAGVQFLVDGAPIGTEITSSPYSLSVNTATLSNGAHTIAARARDTSNNVNTSAVVNVTVSNSTTPPSQKDPLLLITDPTNRFTQYYSEIMLTEGMNYSRSSNLSAVTASVLAGYHVAVLPEMPLTTAQATMFTDWVNAGGRLIAMRPDKKLAGLLGLTDTGSTLADAWLQFNTASGPGAGLVATPIQFHGTADRYTASGATTLATLYTTASASTPNPAVSFRAVGTNGGQAAAFTYDLARSVILTRQGNPAWAGQQRDGIDGYQASEMFVGINGQPDWNDLGNAQIPIADEQQRLFANLVDEMSADRLPLPRFWYYPNAKRAVIVMTGDDHGLSGTIGSFDRFKQLSPAGCNLDNWECVRSSSYISWNTQMSAAQATQYTNEGFELGVHVNTICRPYGSPSDLATIYRDQLQQFRWRFPALVNQDSTRTHCVEWDDYVSQAKVKLQNNIRLDTDYYYFPASWVQNRPGFFNGAGSVMRFADLDGSLINVFQATTHLTDESGQSSPATVNLLLDNAIGPKGYFATLTMNAHTDTPGSPISDDAVASALARGVPVVSGRQMLRWLDGRNATSFNSLAWNGSSLSFGVAGGTNMLRGMLPRSTPAGTLTRLTRGGATIPTTNETIKGRQYVFFESTAGSYVATYGNGTPPNTPPTITSTTPSTGATGVSATAPIRVVFSKAMDSATINTSTIELRNSAGALIGTNVSYDAATTTALVQPAAALAASTTYTVLVKGTATAPNVKDTSGTPMAANAQFSFTSAATPQPPTVTSFSPANGATGVATTSTVRATFSTAMDATTINASTVELRSSSGAMVSANVSYDAAATSAVVSPTAPLAASTSYTLTIRGTATAPSVRDATGLAMAANATSSFTTASAPPTGGGTLVGRNTIGSVLDDGATNHLNGSRIVNGATQNSVTQISAYLKTIDAPGRQSIQMAIYTDNNGSPGSLVASSAVGTAVSNSWNSLAISATLAPNTAYWLFFNSNGENNMSYDFTSGQRGAFSNQVFGAWPASVGASSLHTAWYSIYVQ
jgi:hypothetical protein